MTVPKPVVVCILDGWGMREEPAANAPMQAKTPNFDRIWETCPRTLLSASGEAVGLPEGQIGNSEVGHTNIGAGRVVWMDLPRISRAIRDGSFATNDVLLSGVADVKAAGGVMHIAGLLSDGGVHSHIDHMIAATQAVTGAGVQVKLHVFLDGRDVAPSSATGYVADLEARMPSGADVATVSGRFFAMDRDNRWERVSAAYRAMVNAEGASALSAGDAVTQAASAGETDEFVTPHVIAGYGGMQDDDGLFFANFRADRAREILSAIVDPDFAGFNAGKRPKLSATLGMVSYSDRLSTMMGVMFPPEEIVNTLGAYLAGLGKAQFRIAETEKYPHVTYFLNGGVEEPYPGEVRYMAPSPKVKTYDMQPEMSAGEVTENLVQAINGGEYDLIVVNYANPDMVGHTGDLDAAIAACEAVDEGLGEVLTALETAGGAMLVTADHGNCDMMVDPETGGPHTAHTLSPVPLVLVGGPQGVRLEQGGVLGDLAPTVLELMELQAPEEMTGRSLIGK